MKTPDAASGRELRLFFFGRVAWWPKPAIPVWGWRNSGGQRVRDLGRLTYYPGGF